MNDRDLKKSAMMLKEAIKALQIAEAHAVTDAPLKQQIADLRASVEHTTLAIHETIRLKIEATRKLN